jgi:hypothetical protein
MTSPGGWFGGFLDDVTTGNPTAPGSSRSTPTPKGGGRSGGGSYSDTPPPVVTEQLGDKKDRATAGALYDALELPPEWRDDVFTMGTYDNGQTVMRMTVEKGLLWLRDLAANPATREQYNSWIVKLYDAGYLTESEARFGAYTSAVGQAFVEAAYDTAMTNLNGEEGSLVSLGDNLSAIAEEAAKMGAGSGGAAPRVRIDQVLDEATLKDSLRETSRSLLGRSLTDAEEASLVGRFRSVETAWNGQNWAAETSGGRPLVGSRSLRVRWRRSVPGNNSGRTPMC